MAERRLCLQGQADEEAALEFDEDVVAGTVAQHFQRKVSELSETTESHAL